VAVSANLAEKWQAFDWLNLWFPALSFLKNALNLPLTLILNQL